MPKRESPCLDYGYYSDGVAVMWKKGRFEKVDETNWDGSFFGGDGDKRGVPMVKLKSTFEGVDWDQQQGWSSLEPISRPRKERKKKRTEGDG